MRHVLFVHQNFPAQFGHIAAHLAENHGYRCTFVTQREINTPQVGQIHIVRYPTKGGARQETHYCSRTFENAIWHAHGVYEALAARPDIQPDLIVGHSGFGSTIFLRELYQCPIINYFEYYYRTKDSDMDFRHEFPSQKIDQLRARARNAMILLDLENCNTAYSPTRWQRDRFPTLYHHKIHVIFDGIDTTFWKPVQNPTRKWGALQIPPGMKVVTYVSRGMESMRGFDIFMKVAKRLCDERNDVICLIAGEDRVCYGGDLKHISQKSFKEWVLAQDQYDLTRIRFLGRITPQQLVELFSLSDLHIYLTVPFVLSWSLMDALACQATVLASNTAPVQEMIQPQVNGLLSDFYDIDGFVAQAHQVLNNLEDHRHLGENGRKMIEEYYSLQVCLPRMLQLYEAVSAPTSPLEISFSQSAN